MENWAYALRKEIQNIVKDIVKSLANAGGFFVGTVVKPLPNIIISLDDDIVLDKDDIIIANQIYTKHSHQANEYNTPNNFPLEIGDKVILLSDASGQRYALIDKEGE